jgi:2'-5' RNA ligase
MFEQLSLFGLESKPKTDRLFIGIFPDTATAPRIARLAEGMRAEENLRGRPLATDRLHITVNHLGDFPELPQDVIRDASQAAAALAASMAPFEVTFDRAASFDTKNRNLPFVLLGEEEKTPLHRFHEALNLELATVGLKRMMKSKITPHVTLLYDGRNVPVRAAGPVSWTVNEFVLVHSLLGQTEHRRLCAWPLRG